MYKPRLKAPAPNNVLWTKKNPFHSAGYGLPNCTAYAWGRWYEIIGKAPKLSLGNAGNWYKNIKDGYDRGDTPRLGAVICWSKVGGEAQGKGHVAIVEDIKADGSIVIGESGYKKFRFRIMTLKPPYTYFTGYKLQGFIYCPKVAEKTYRVLSTVNIRQKASLTAPKAGKLKKSEYVTGIPQGTWLKTDKGYARIKGIREYIKEI